MAYKKGEIYLFRT